MREPHGRGNERYLRQGKPESGENKPELGEDKVDTSPDKDVHREVALICGRLASSRDETPSSARSWPCLGTKHPDLREDRVGIVPDKPMPRPLEVICGNLSSSRKISSLTPSRTTIFRRRSRLRRGNSSLICSVTALSREFPAYLE